MHRFRCLLLCVAFLAFGGDVQARTATEVAQCMRESRPDGNVLETIELSSEDRLGNRVARRGVVYSGRADDGVPVMFLRFVFPSDLRGSTFLIAQREAGAQMFVSLSGDPSALQRQILGGDGDRPLFGSDFSAEDLRRLYGLHRTDSPATLSEGEVDGRPTWVLRVEPDEEERSSFGAIVISVDQATCVALRARYYGAGEELRRELSVPVDSLRSVENGWIAGEVLMKDLRDGTQTRLTVDSVESGERVRDLPFVIPHAPEPPRPTTPPPVSAPPIDKPKA